MRQSTGSVSFVFQSRISYDFTVWQDGTACDTIQPTLNNYSQPTRGASSRGTVMMIYADASALVETRCTVARKRRNREVDALLESRISNELTTDIRESVLLPGEIAAAAPGFTVHRFY